MRFCISRLFVKRNLILQRLLTVFSCCLAFLRGLGIRKYNLMRNGAVRRSIPPATVVGQPVSTTAGLSEPGVLAAGDWAATSGQHLGTRNRWLVISRVADASPQPLRLYPTTCSISAITFYFRKYISLGFVHPFYCSISIVIFLSTFPIFPLVSLYILVRYRCELVPFCRSVAAQDMVKGRE